MYCLPSPARRPPLPSKASTPPGPMAYAYPSLSLHPLTLSRPANVKLTNKKSLSDSLVPTFSFVCRSDAHSVPTRSWFPFLRRLHHSLPPLSGSDFSIRWCPLPSQGMPYGPIQAGAFQIHIRKHPVLPQALTSLPTCSPRPLYDSSFLLPSSTL